MSRSNWLYVIALGGCLAVASALAPESVHQVYAASPSADTEPKQQATSPSAISPGSDANQDATDYANPCEGPRTKENGDLCQQWRMAKFAGQQVKLINRQLLASYGEIFLLVVTFGASLVTANIGFRTSRAELRAYVGARPDLVDLLPETPFFADIVLENTGQTPAFNMRYFHAAVVLPEPPPPAWQWPEGPISPTTTILHQGSSQASHLNPNLFEPPGTHNAGPVGNLAQRIRAREVTLYIYGILYYDDAFGVEHYTRFRFKVNHRSFVDGHPVAIRSMEGNEAT